MTPAPTRSVRRVRWASPVVRGANRSARAVLPKRTQILLKSLRKFGFVFRNKSLKQAQIDLKSVQNAQIGARLYPPLPLGGGGARGGGGIEALAQRCWH